MKRMFAMTVTGLILGGEMIASAQALTQREINQLAKLDPQTRLEQRCDIEAMLRLKRETRWAPDRVLAYAFGDPKISRHRIRADGAAFRSHGKWYRLAYDCTTAADNITINTFHYKIGAPVPRSNWEAHYLVP